MYMYMLSQPTMSNKTWLDTLEKQLQCVDEFQQKSYLTLWFQY